MLSFNDPPTTETYTLSLHDALPIFQQLIRGVEHVQIQVPRVVRKRNAHAEDSRGRHVEQEAVLVLGADASAVGGPQRQRGGDRKSTRLNSSHGYISYAVFCLKKKNL